MTNSKPDALPVVAVLDAPSLRSESHPKYGDGMRVVYESDYLREIARRYAELAELREQSRILRSGLKGDFDLDSWLEWAKGKKAMEAELTTLRARLAELEQQKPVQADCVGVMRDEPEGGLRVEWLLEGDTAELMAGMYLFCLDGGDCLFEDGSGQLYAAPVAGPSQVDAEVVQVPRELALRVVKGDPTTGANAIQLNDAWNAMDELRALLATSQEQAK